MYKWLKAHCQYREPGRFQGQMFEVGEYPAVVAAPDENAWVSGEIYRVLDPELLFPRLDRYEGCTDDGANGRKDPHSLYLRVEMPVNLESGGELPVWIYLYNQPTGRLKRIPGGDYLHR